MVLPIGVQINIIIFSFLAGMIIGLLFDGYRLIRGFNSSKIMLVIQDGLFWILVSLIVFVFLLYFDYGFLSLYIYLTIALGLGLYLIIFSRLIFKVENAIAVYSCRVIRITGKNIRYVFKNIFTK